MSDGGYSYEAPIDDDEEWNFDGGDAPMIELPKVDDLGDLDTELAKLEAERNKRVQGEKKFTRSNSKFFDDEHLGESVIFTLLGLAKCK
jgi:hypothetical protein